MTGILSTCDVKNSATPASAEVWGLISDVHGNYTALEHALRVLGSAGARRLAFLGDYLGRGDSDACVRRIRGVADAAIVGNRDLDWQDRVSAESKAWVMSLPRTVCLGPLLLSHGDARLTPGLSTADINRDFLRPWSALETHDARVWAFGHSHFARTWRKAERVKPAQEVTGPVTALEDDVRYFVNVGTTGLPFPGKGGPSVALIDFKQAVVRHIALESQSR
jgi:predicted phosphodiesterase